MLRGAFNLLTLKEKIFWLGSLALLLLTGFFLPEKNFLATLASLIGVTSILLCAKGHLGGPFLMIIFSLLYAFFSWRLSYWGEVVTYLGMTLPLSVWALVTWFKNPNPKKRTEVLAHRMQKREWLLSLLLTIVVTALFFWLLKFLKTPFLPLATLSVATSFSAAWLTGKRSAFFNLAYAANDVVLIFLWAFTAGQKEGFTPLLINFLIFLVNDVYSYICWQKREALTGEGRGA